jgi:predicted phage tail component-like protein
MMFALFNNLNSYYDLDLIIEHNPNIPVPQKNINTIEVEGRNGSLTEDLGTYKDIEIPVSFALADENIKPKCRQIKAWLIGNILDNKLIFDDDLGFFYKVKYVKISNDITRLLEALGRFTAIFVCEPFCFGLAGLEHLELSQPAYIYNDGYDSEPYLKIYATGDVTLTINNKNIILQGINNYIELDSEMENCYKDTQPLNDKMIGEFPIFMPGENAISWTGNVTKIELIARWRWL